MWRKSLQIDPPPFGAGFCADLFWASLVLLGVERAWSNFVTGVDWYKDGGGSVRGMSRFTIVGLNLRDGLISADSYPAGATTGLFAPSLAHGLFWVS